MQADKRNWRWIDAHFCSLPSQTSFHGTCGVTTTPQTNVYGHAKVVEPDGTHKLLVASLAGKLLSVEYQRNSNKLKPSTKEIQFTYIPGGAELISLDVASKSCKEKNKGLLVGITFLKPKNQLEDTEGSGLQYLNIYSSCLPGEEYLESVSQGCVSIPLNFMPYQLTHTALLTENGIETVFLLSGNDNQVHVYREIQEQSFAEETTNIYFPELCCNSSILWLDIVYFEDHKKRLTAQGHKSGQVYLSLVDAENLEVIRGWEAHFDSPITNIQIFPHENQVQCPSFLDKTQVEHVTKGTSSTPVYNLLVISALESAVVYRDVLSNGLKDALVLPLSSNWDVPLCACVVDIDFDGQNEILIGTYGQELLAYKWMEEVEEVPIQPTIIQTAASSDRLCSSLTWNEMSEQLNIMKHRHRSNENDSSRNDVTDSKIPPRKSKSHENLSSSLKSSSMPSESPKTSDCGVINEVHECSRKKVYKLLWQRSFPSPVVGVDRLDIMGDGMDDLVVVTLRGVHIIQPDLNEVSKVCLERMRALTMNTEGEDELIHMKIDHDSFPVQSTNSIDKQEQS